MDVKLRLVSADAGVLVSAASASILKPTLLTQVLRVFAGAVALGLILILLRRLLKRRRSPALGIRGAVCGKCGQTIETKGQIAGNCKHVGCPQSICQECWAADPDDRFCQKHSKAASNE